MCATLHQYCYIVHSTGVPIFALAHAPQCRAVFGSDSEFLAALGPFIGKSRAAQKKAVSVLEFKSDAKNPRPLGGPA